MDVRRFSDAILYNYITGSPDGHAKNFSLLFAGRQVRLAPLYDLATGAPYDNRDAPPYSAFKVGGLRNFGEAYEKHWRAHAEEMDLDVGERLDRVHELLDAVPDAFREALLNDDALGDGGPVLWRRMTEQPGHLLKQITNMKARLTPTPPSRPEKHAIVVESGAARDVVAATRAGLARGERPLAATDQLGLEVDRLRELMATYSTDSTAEVAASRRAELLVASRPAVALAMTLASEPASAEPETWIRQIQQLGETQGAVYGSAVLTAQLRLPAFALLTGAGLAATVAERWSLVDRLLTEIPVEARTGVLGPLAVDPDLVEACSGQTSFTRDQPSFRHPMGLLAAYIADVAKEYGLLSSSDVETSWDRWEYLWLASRTGAQHPSGVPHLVVTNSQQDSYVPAVRRWFQTPLRDRDERLSWLSSDVRDPLDMWLIKEAVDIAYSTVPHGSEGGSPPSGRWRMDSRGRGQIPPQELMSWRAFLIGRR